MVSASKFKFACGVIIKAVKWVISGCLGNISRAELARWRGSASAAKSRRTRPSMSGVRRSTKPRNHARKCAPVHGAAKRPAPARSTTGTGGAMRHKGSAPNCRPVRAAALPVRKDGSVTTGAIGRRASFIRRVCECAGAAARWCLTWINPARNQVHCKW